MKTHQNCALSYAKIFLENFNLGFHKLKNYQCSLGITYTNMTAEERRKNTDYKEHITNKNLARLVKQNLKRGSNHPFWKYSVFVFDLKVLQKPLTENSEEFSYCSTFSVYNISCFHLSTKQGHCLVWDESIARRGANKIADCLFMFTIALL